MIEQTPAPDDTLPAPEGRQIDAVCDRFEAAWQAGRQPHISDYLGEVIAPLRRSLLRELLLLDLDYRRRAGEMPHIADYAAQFPDDVSLIATVLGPSADEPSLPPGQLPAWVVRRLVAHARRFTGAALPERPGGGPGEEPGDEVTVPDGIRARWTKGADEADDRTIGLLGDYELCDVLGRGGMGVVYKALHRPSGRVVALKVIRHDLLETLADEERREWLARFREEARAAARSEHAHVVTIYDVGESEGRPYYAMRLIQGRSLAEELREGPLEGRRAAGLMEAVARAVQHIHDCDVLHRDLKPRNILLDAQGQPHLTDFGLAKCLHGAADADPTRYPIGTPAYMAPEQARAPGRVGRATDVYGLGATLYALLTGRPPFQASDPVETLRQVVDCDPVPPRQLNAAVDRDLELICLKCLHKEPGRRYASAAQLADELERYRTRQPLRHTRPVGVSERLWRWCRRNPGPTAAIVAISFASTLLAAGVGHYRYQVVPREQERNDQLRSAHRESAALHIGQGLMLCERGEAQEGLLWLARGVRSASLGEDPERERVARINLAAWGQQVRPLLAAYRLPSTTQVMALSPDGQRLAVGGNDGTVTLYDPNDGERIAELGRHDEPVNALAFSPDGATLATGAGDPSPNRVGQAPEVVLWDLKTGKRLQVLAHLRAVLAVAFLPDGQRLVSGTWDGRAYLWEVTSGRQVRVFGPAQPGPLRVFGVVPSPDGRSLLTLRESAQGTLAPTEVDQWDTATGQPIQPPQFHPKAPIAAAFLDGKPVIALAADRDGGDTGPIVRVVDLTTGKTLRSLPQNDFVVRLGFSPEGTTLATQARLGLVRLWDTQTGILRELPLMHPAGTADVVLPLQRGPLFTRDLDGIVRAWGPTSRVGGAVYLSEEAKRDQVLTLAVRPDGQALVSGGLNLKGEASYWEHRDGRFERHAVPHPWYLFASAFSPDGSAFALGGMGGPKQQVAGARVWSCATREPLSPPLLHEEGNVTALVFTADGQYLWTACSDGKLRLWDREGGLRAQFLAHAGGVQALALRPDGVLLASAGKDRAVRFWNAATGEPQGPPLEHGDGVNAVAISPDGQALFTGSGSPDGLGKGEVRVYDLASGRERWRTSAIEKAVHCLAVSPDGATLLAGGGNGVGGFWDVATGCPLGPSLRHGGTVRAAAFLPDGSLGLTGANRANTVRGWPVPVLGHFTAQTARVWTEALTGLELRLEGRLMLHPLDPDDWQRRLRDLP